MSVNPTVPNHLARHLSNLAIVSFSAVLLQACAVAPATDLTPMGTTTLSMDVQEMLNAHNQVRASVGLAGLTWSANLASYAQTWADTLANQQACGLYHRHELGMELQQYGENLYWASALDWSDGRREIQAMRAAQVAQDWASESAHYNYEHNDCRPGEQCGHYTQMVWHSTTQVGCGVAVCPDAGQIWVCNYNPPGNWQGLRPY